MNDFDVNLLMPIVAELSEKYTKKESSSVSYDTARRLMNAVVYCVSEAYKEDTNSICIVDVKDMKLLYEQGYDIVVKKTIKANEFYSNMLLNFDEYNNECLTDTVVKGLPAFFLYYDPKFNPQDHLLTLDYPTILTLGKKVGIDAIELYLKYIYLEQKFMGEFSRDKIILLFEKYHFDYEILIINLCELVLKGVIGCLITQKDVYQLEINEEDLDVIYQFSKNYTRIEQEEKISKMILLMVEQIFNGDKDLSEYLLGYVKNFVSELLNGASNKTLDNVFSCILVNKK